MKHFQEWTLGKAIVVIDRFFKLIQKRSGESYSVTSIPSFYQNTYGKFAGYWVVGSKGNVFRVNFLQTATTEEIVSIDRFSRSDEKLITPIDTLSTEGFGISKIYNCVIDWMNGLSFTEAVEGTSFQEAYAFKGAVARYLTENPEIVEQIKNDKLDQVLYLNSIVAFTKSEGYTQKISMGYLLATTQSVLEGMKNGKSIAKNVPVPFVFPGVPSKPAATNDAMLQKFGGGNPSDWKRFLDDLDSPNTVNPLGVIKNYREYVVDMVEEPDNTAAGVIAWGRGGTGKSYHAEQSLKSIGLVEGVHYRTFGGKISGGSEALIGLLYDTKEFQVAIIDDADNIFAPNYRTILLNALQSDNNKRRISVTAKIKSPAGVEITEDFTLTETKFIFATNKDVSTMDTAFKRRLKSFNFDFTDEEMIVLIKQSFDTMLPEDPNLTPAIKVEVFNMLQAAFEKKKLKRADFGVMMDCLRAYSLAINRNRDPWIKVAQALKDII